MKSMINADINLSSFKGMLRVVHTQRVNEKPHPFCITGKHIKRFHLDTSAGPCGMRTNEETGEWASKRDNKKGITSVCKLSFEEHTYEVMILFELLQDVSAKKLETALGKGKEMKCIFDTFKIKGFQFIKTEPQYHIV